MSVTPVISKKSTNVNHYPKCENSPIPVTLNSTSKLSSKVNKYKRRFHSLLGIASDVKLRVAIMAFI
jgi:hypothetical protein